MCNNITHIQYNTIRMYTDVKHVAGESNVQMETRDQPRWRHKRVEVPLKEPMTQKGWDVQDVTH